MADWLAKYSCADVYMESTGNYWIPVFEKACGFTLAHLKYTKPQKGNKTDRKDAKWICDLHVCGMFKPSFILPPDIRQLRDLMWYRTKIVNMLTSRGKSAAPKNTSPPPISNWTMCFPMCSANPHVLSSNTFRSIPVNSLT